MATRVIVYIDGFNLYHALAALGDPHLKWLDLWSLSEKIIRNGEHIEAVKYFTAYATWRAQSYRRHQRYVAALECQGVTAVVGRFKEKQVRCKACGARYVTHEEKETDVNIGAHLAVDALKNRFDRALVISADTDLTPAVRLIRAETAGKLIDIVAPPGRKRFNNASLFEIAKGKLHRSLLPEILVTRSGRNILRPPEYSPPT